MSVTVLENIATTLKTRLEAMTVASAFQTAVVEVIRPTPNDDYSPKNLQIVMRQGASERVPELDYPGNPPAVARRQAFNLHLHIQDKSQTDADDTTANTFVADVVKAVAVDAHWYTFGGYAIDAEFQDYQPIVSDGGMGGVMLPLAVTYRTSELDPYTAR